MKCYIYSLRSSEMFCVGFLLFHSLSSFYLLNITFLGENGNFILVFLCYFFTR